MATKNYSPVVQELIDLIAKNGWEDRFQKALDACHALNTIEYENIKTLDDYYDWLEGELKWIPVENPEGTIVYEHVTMFYFLLDQSPVKELQTPIIPSKLKGNEEPPLTPLSQWMRKYVVSFGAWMDQPESLNDEAVKSYYDSPRYNMGDYEMPEGGWKTFNQFFARRKKPGYMPIAAINDDHVITSPADSTNDGQWEINAESKVNIKGLEWSIEELLEGSEYKDDFAGAGAGRRRLGRVSLASRAHPDHLRGYLTDFMGADGKSAACQLTGFSRGALPCLADIRSGRHTDLDIRRNSSCADTASLLMSGLHRADRGPASALPRS